MLLLIFPIKLQKKSCGYHFEGGAALLDQNENCVETVQGFSKKVNDHQVLKEVRKKLKLKLGVPLAPWNIYVQVKLEEEFIVRCDEKMLRS